MKEQAGTHTKDTSTKYNKHVVNQQRKHVHHVRFTYFLLEYELVFLTNIKIIPSKNKI